MNPHPMTPSPEFQVAVDTYWEELSRTTGARYWRGPVFGVQAVDCVAGDLSLRLRPSDYPHYLYSIRRAPAGPDAFRVLYAAAILETAADANEPPMLVVGEMGPHTAYPQRIQGVGGAIDPTDVVGDRVDLEASLRRELEEKLGSADWLETAPLEPLWLKDGGPYNFLAVIYRIRCPFGYERLQEMFQAFSREERRHGREPVLARLVGVPKDADGASRFLARDRRPRVDYLEPAVSQLTGAVTVTPARRRAGVVVRVGDAVALIERRVDGRLYYVFPGGGVEAGETMEEAASREAWEELGVTVTVGRLVARVRFGESLQDYFAATITGGHVGTGRGPEFHTSAAGRGGYRAVLVDVATLPQLDVRPRGLADALTASWYPDGPVYITEVPPTVS